MWPATLVGMTDSDPKLPDPTGAGAPPPEPGQPTPPAGSPAPSDAVPPTLPSDASAPMDPTTQMPATEPGAGEGVPPVPPGDAPGDADSIPEDEVPWYKKPGPIAIMVLVALAILALLAWFIWGGDDDDGATATSSLLILETTDETGSEIDVGFIVSVVGPAEAPTSFEWLRPDGVAPGEAAGANTGTDGRVDFEWQADESVAEPEAWQSTVSAVVNVPAGWVPFGPVIDCVRDPLEGTQTTVAMAIELDSPDSSIERVGALTFPNYTFAPGDTVTCRLAASSPPPTTSSTVVETTTPATTTPETTTPETTTAPTTVAPTTAPPQTTTAPTTPPTTPPPATATEALQAAGNFTTFLGLVDQVQAAKDLLEGAGPVTVFAPNDDAFNGVTPPADPADLEQLLLSHIVDGDALDSAAVLAAADVPVASGGVQPVDAAATPPTIGGAGIIGVDITSTNGFSHELDGIMPAVAP